MEMKISRPPVLMAGGLTEDRIMPKELTCPSLLPFPSFLEPSTCCLVDVTELLSRLCHLKTLMIIHLRKTQANPHSPCHPNGHKLKSLSMLDRYTAQEQLKMKLKCK
mmetsp:Transcript_7048/g.43269  ORF Transcript_7048/g.43269 Transcript_7048/m.43269 type:complete len:107 (+) Transcript_7048:1545-1865(+)